MRDNFYPWNFVINFNIFESEDVQNIIKVFSESNYNDKIFLKYFHNLLISRGKFRERKPSYSEIVAYQLINEIYFFIVFKLADENEQDYLFNFLLNSGISERKINNVKLSYVKFFKPFDLLKQELQEVSLKRKLKNKKLSKEVLSYLLITRIMNENPACTHFNLFFEDSVLLRRKSYKAVIKTYKETLKERPVVEPFRKPLLKVLYEPIEKNPYSILDQLEYIKGKWKEMLPSEIFEKFDVLKSIIEEENIQKGAGGPGPIKVIEFKKTYDAKHETYDYPEFEAYTPDTDWMPNVVLIAKMAYVWLYQLSKKYGREIKRLDEIPDEELDKLAKWGFNALWLIGIWERSPASQRIKHLCGNIDAASSAYSLYDYTVAEELGGWQALDSLKERAWKRGIRLACDIVPNHMGIVSKWIFEHPDWFLQCDFSPYPNYRFTGENLSTHPDYIIQIEDGYYTRTDAAVVFRFEEKVTGKVRYIYHGNDGTSTPWNDTAQLNYLLPVVREKMIQTIVNIARHFPIIRFDAAMTLAKKHYQRLWFPLPGHGGGVPSRSMFSMKKSEFDKLMPKEFWREVVETINSQLPDTLLIAEAFWLMEGYFVRTLGMHRVYNSAFMNMLKLEENAKYRQTIKNILEFDRRILQRFVNFMNNPDEKTAVEQFGKGDKYFGVAVMLVTMPGLPMFGHGQIEGFHEKYGMEYKRAYYDEQPDQYFISLHEDKIFPLMKRRRLFSGSEHFYLFDFMVDDHNVNENVFVYSNMYGSERALIVYNNHLTTTKGTIKNSVKYLKKFEDGKEVFETKSLQSALGFKNEPGYFYICRDYNSRLEYLFKGEDVSKKGIFFEVKGYQYYVFLDFKEIYDEQGYYEKLYQKLNNKPVKSIKEELKFVKYKEIHATLKNLMQDFTVQMSKDSYQYEELSKRVSAFYICLQEKNFLNFPIAEKAEETIKMFKNLLINFENISDKYEDFKNYKKVVSLIALLYSIFYHQIKSNENYCLRDLIRELRLDVVLKDIFKEFIENGVLEHYYANLFHIFNMIIKYLDEFENFAFVEKMFNDEEDCSILGCNIHQGIRWFNKELFEFFLVSIMIINLERTEQEKLDVINQTVEIAELAKKTNYKLEFFLKSIRDVKTKISNSNLTQGNL